MTIASIRKSRAVKVVAALALILALSGCQPWFPRGFGREYVITGGSTLSLRARCSTVMLPLINEVAGGPIFTTAAESWWQPWGDVGLQSPITTCDPYFVDIGPAQQYPIVAAANLVKSISVRDGRPCGSSDTESNQRARIASATHGCRLYEGRHTYQGIGQNGYKAGERYVTYKNPSPRVSSYYNRSGAPVVESRAATVTESTFPDPVPGDDRFGLMVIPDEPESRTVMVEPTGEDDSNQPPYIAVSTNLTNNGVPIDGFVHSATFLDMNGPAASVISVYNTAGTVIGFWATGSETDGYGFVDFASAVRILNDDLDTWQGHLFVPTPVP